MKITSALLLLTISTLAVGMNTDGPHGSTFQDRPAKRQRIIEPSEFPSTEVFNDFEYAEEPPETVDHQPPSLIPIDEVLDDFTINEDAAPLTPLADRKTTTPNIAPPILQADNEGNSDDDSASPRGKQRRFFGE
ncbi:hypothetical protein BKA69DRAFT_379039 [Paraphysoderma sedebokerense]|nr:hypothetical protein BKA69DRAFT_379039 [Paraphysoderma sedebokerense]